MPLAEVTDPRPESVYELPEPPTMAPASETGVPFLVSTKSAIPTPVTLSLNSIAIESTDVVRGEPTVANEAVGDVRSTTRSKVVESAPALLNGSVAVTTTS